MFIMERSEPALIPEWLKSNGSASGGNNALNQRSSSPSLHSDDHAKVVPTRSKYSFGNGGYDSPRSVFVDSSFFNRKTGSNGSVMHEKSSYSSFGGRNRRDRDWDADLSDICNKERWFMGDRRDRYSTPFGVSANSFTNRIEKNELRRSRSMISENQAEWRSRRVAMNPRIRNNNGCSDAGGIMAGVVQKTSFERNFPSLGGEERPGTPDIARASSPQSSPIGSSAVVGHDGWTSALADVPVVAGSNSMVHSSVQQNAPEVLSTAASSTTSALNMAETLAQAPSRAQSTPQISVETQRLEELAMKQSRQLIPVTSLVPKTSVFKSDKSKLKLATRSEMNPASKNGYQQLSAPHFINHTVRAGHAKSDIAQSSHVGKLLVLKPAQERNGIFSDDKDTQTNSARVANNPPVDAPLSSVAPLRSSNNPKNSATEPKAFSHLDIYALPVEKRASVSQAQSRNDFFKLMRKKNSANLSSPPTDPNLALSTVAESSNDSIMEVSSAVTSQANDPPSSDVSCYGCSTGNGANMASNCDDFVETQTYANNIEKCSIPFEVVHVEEEERAFLCSLGWEENAGDVEGLTEEEIKDFYKKYMPVKASLKSNCGFWEPKRPASVISRLDSFGSAELSSSSSDTDSDA